MELEKLVQELAELASHLAAGMCRWLGLVGEVDRRKHWAEEGRESCGAWLAWRCGLTPRAAREHVRVARRLAELPEIQASFARGELSYAKVRALTRVAEPATEAELIQLASVLTASQLERAIRVYRNVTAQEAEELHERAYLDAHWDDDGSFVVRGRLAPEDGAVVERALEAAADDLWAKKDDGSAEPQPRPTRAEALVAVAEASLAGNEVSRSADRFQVVVHVDENTLVGGEGVSTIADGPAIASETVRRLACDASVVRMRERHGKPVSVGRKTRSVPPALRRALVSHDQRCCFPGCESRRVDAHHIHHWARGGETRLDNLVLLCRRHHRLVHEGGYAVDEKRRFYDRWGRRIPAAHSPPPGDADELLAINESLAIDGRTLRHGRGDRMDLGLTVSGIVQIAGRAG